MGNTRVTSAWIPGNSLPPIKDIVSGSSGLMLCDTVDYGFRTGTYFAYAEKWLCGSVTMENKHIKRYAIIEPEEQESSDVWHNHQGQSATIRAHAVSLLETIKTIFSQKMKARELGIDLTYFETGTTALEQSAAIVTSTTTENYEYNLDKIRWWLYERADNFITVDYGEEQVKFNVATTEDFVKFLTSPI